MLIKLLINADDFGISLAVNEAINYCFRNSLIQRTTIMINMPYTEDAVKISYSNGFNDKVGLHLNLVEGVPLTEKIRKTRFCDDKGNFNGLIFKKFKNRIFLDPYTRDAVSEEIEAQIVKYKISGFSLMHIDSHQHSHTNPSIYHLLFPLLVKYKFKTLRLSRNIPQSEIRGIKGLYKKILNKKILSFNKRLPENAIFCAEKFGSLNDIEKESSENKNLNEKIEIEIHPSIFDNKLIDLYNQKNIEIWLKKYSYAT